MGETDLVLGNLLVEKTRCQEGLEGQCSRVWRWGCAWLRSLTLVGEWQEVVRCSRWRWRERPVRRLPQGLSRWGQIGRASCRERVSSPV